MVPPAKDVVVERVDDWPESIVLGLAEMMGGDSAGLTVTIAGLDVIVAGDPELSVTLSSNDQVPTVVKVPVCRDAGEVHKEAALRLA